MNKFQSSIFFKIFLSLIFIILFLISISFLISIKFEQYHFLNILYERTQKICESIKKDITKLIEKNDIDELNRAIRDISKNIQYRITIVSSKGIVLADSEKNPAVMENHLNRIEIKKALAGEIGKDYRYSLTTKKKLIYVAIPIYSQNERFVCRLSYNDYNFKKFTDLLIKKTFLLSISSVIIAIFITLFFYNYLSKPINEILFASDKIANGDFKSKLYFRNKNEFSRLAENFNYMTEKLSQMFMEINKNSEELSTIINSIQEPLIVINKLDYIIKVNESFNNIFYVSDEKQKKYYEVIRNVDFIEFINNIKSNSTNSSTEIIFLNKIYIINSSIIPSTKDLIILWHDITEIKNLEKIKKDFIVNASHELKTPLTAIKGFAEILDSELSGEQKHYIEIIRRHSDRIILMINDLLALSRMEDNNVSYSFSKINIIEPIENAISLLKNKAEKKGLQIKKNIPLNIPHINGEEFQLEQLFINIIDNAIRYTEKGFISINVFTDNNKLCINVADTGIGIEEIHINRIFERFYVTDKARSRENGGTGLGLSIVKHIINLHSGSISVKSELSKGSTFFITFPILSNS